MAGELLLINPRRRRSRKKRSSSYKRRRVSRARRNPTYRRRRSTAVAVAAPRTVSRRRRRSSRYRRYSSAIRRSYSRAAGSSIGSFLSGKVLPGLVGAGGALAIDLAWPHLPIPDSLKAGPLAPVVRIAGAIGVGMAASAIGGKKFGNEAMGGAIVVTLYDLLKGFIQKDFPSLPMSAFVSGYDELGWISPAQQVGMDAFVP